MSDAKHRLIEEGKNRLGQILEERIDDRKMTLDEIEAVVEEVMREVAAWVEERLIEEQRPPKTNRAACPQCAAGCKYKRRVDVRILTIHGLRRLRRRYHYCSACQKGFSPTDAALGLEPGRDATRKVRAWQGKYGSTSAFAAVPELLRELRGLEVSASTVERTTVEIGQRLRTTKRSWGLLPAPAVSGPDRGTLRWYFSIDGTMCPLRDEWRRDGSLGKLHCRYGEAKLGIAFQTDHKDGLDTGVVRRGCVGTMGEIAEFRPLVLELGRQWGMDETAELIVLADGAEWIWTLASTYYPHAIQILDYWHMTEHLWTVANAMHGKSTAAGKAWVTDAQEKLKLDLTASFLRSLEEWAPGTAEAQEEREAALTYFAGNAARMKYGTYLKKGYMIGSGVMESGCRHLAKQRLHHAGMHWREGTADAILAIRTHIASTGSPPLSQYA